MIEKFGPTSEGLGDALLLTAVCKYFPQKITIQLPHKNERYKFLFDGLAKDVEITDEINKLPNIGYGHYAKQILRNFLNNADELDIRPLTLFSEIESEKWVSNFLSDIKNPIIFVPNCSKRWHEVRSLNKDLFIKILDYLNNQNMTPIICVSSENDIDVDGVIKLKDLDLKKYTCLLRRVGRYIGCNTGDMHLAISTGCNVDVFQPKNSNFFNPIEWDYDHPTINYNFL